MRQILFLAILLIIQGCSTNKKDHRNRESQSKQVVYVSIMPLKYMVEKIVGDRFDVKVLVPSGSSPETFSPSTRQITDLSHAVAFFKIGNLGFENSWMTKLQDSNPSMEIISSSTGVDMIKSEDGCAEHNHGEDPHIWLSAKIAKQMAENIKEGVHAIDPVNQEVYEKNLIQFNASLDSIDQIISKELEPLAGKSFIVFHPTLGYLAKEYNLNQVAIEKDGKEPSAKQMARIISLAKKENIRTILIQAEFNKASAKTLAKEIGAQLVEIQPLDYDWMSEMNYIAKSIAQSNQN